VPQREREEVDLSAAPMALSDGLSDLRCSLGGDHT